MFGRTLSRFSSGNSVKGPLGMSRYKRDDNIIMDLAEVEIKGMNWIQLNDDKDHKRAFLIEVLFGFFL